MSIQLYMVQAVISYIICSSLSLYIISLLVPDNGEHGIEELIQVKMNLFACLFCCLGFFFRYSCKFCFSTVLVALIFHCCTDTCAS